MVHAGQKVISVWSCRAVVSKYSEQDGGLILEAATNWQLLESDALDEVEDQGGAVNLSGHYRCSMELGDRALFSDEEELPLPVSLWEAHEQITIAQEALARLEIEWIHNEFGQDCSAVILDALIEYIEKRKGK